MPPVIAYVRVSSREQGKSGIGLKEQIAQVEAYAQVTRHQIVRIYQEVGSAIGGDSLKRRPQLQEAREHAKRLGCPLVITELDRLSRDSREIELVARSGIHLLAIKDSAEIIGVQLEAARVQKRTELLKDRLKKGIRRAKERGVVFGNPKNLPEAQKKGAKATRKAAMVRQRELAPIVASIREAGAVSGAELTRQLNLLGNRTARGMEWTEQNLRRVLRKIDGGSKVKKANYDGNPKWGSW